MRHQNECIYAVSKSYLHNSLQGQGRCYSFSVLLMRSCCGKVLPERKLFYTTSIQHWLAPTARSIPGDGAGFCTPKNPEAQVNVVQGCILSAALGGTGTSLPLLSAITTRSTRAGDQDELSFFFSLFFFPFFFLPPPPPPPCATVLMGDLVLPSFTQRGKCLFNGSSAHAGKNKQLKMVHDKTKMPL